MLSPESLDLSPDIPGPTRLFTASVEPLEDEECYARALASVSEDRRAKASVYRFAKDRRLSVGAELLLRASLEAWAEEGLPYADGVSAALGAPFEWVRGDHGKPSLQGLPVRFNLSHSGDRVLCALSVHEVGCDIEEIGQCRLRVAERFFAPDEYRLLLKAAVEDRDRLFYEIWTLKESVMKATGLGLGLPPESFSIVRDNPQWVLWSASNPDGYQTALCIARPFRSS